ncbi:AraC family transcriptional regulator [Burkholderia gladioli]|uniref:AraC family transcriptional regulator n=3 Tax=Burkholderia gladioli TaxID=28095 RepID=UPI0016406D46|nr:AraC family transcriptional regulator [Burkholderia gladioli]MDA0569972.1 AraC family transcriptional regulator [Burkholderia gladioli]MDA0598208.1 AraC family transcriptional regulator [Burkholderia gladioli]
MKAADKGTVSIRLVATSIALARQGGADPDALLAQAGIAPDALADPEAHVSARQYGALWNAIARTLDDEFFGQDSHPMRSGTFIAMSQAALGARSGLSALSRALNVMRGVLDDLHAELDVDAQRVRLRFVHREADARPPVFAYATFFIVVYGLTCWLIGRRIPVLRAHLRSAPPEVARDYQQIFCEDLRFDQPESCVEFDPAFATLPVVQSGASLKTFLRNAPGNFIVKYRNPDSLASRVRAVLRAALPADWPDAAGIAARLHVAEATLRRKLRQEGASYQEIKDVLRYEIACAALADSELTVADVASAAGFAEPSAFYRAFKGWSGLSPAAYRERELAAKANRPG